MKDGRVPATSRRNGRTESELERGVAAAPRGRGAWWGNPTFIFSLTAWCCRFHGLQFGLRSCDDLRVRSHGDGTVSGPRNPT
jgi:hypothetical protein